MPSRDRTGHAVAFMIGSALSFTLMGVAVRGAGVASLAQKVLVRNLVTALIAGIWVMRDGRGSVLAWKPWSWRVLRRSCSGLAGVACYFYALDRVPLADASMLNKLSPFFVFLFARVFLKEQLGRPLVAALLVAFAGAMLVIKPRFDAAVVPALVGAASSVFAATAYTLVRSLKGLEPPHRIIFAFSAVSVIVTAPFAAAGWVAPTTGQWLALAAIGVGAAGGQFGLTYAYQLAPAARISVVNYSSIVFALLAGWGLWGEWPDRWSLLGGAMILCAAGAAQIGRGVRGAGAQIVGGDQR